ncbi:heterokaryon incompatibility protein-domain-containing protein [Mycena albidolilacea]|uniref:Heterokaryon incompatibility protein-domain-containing protein n=1 Tax=Mycena albidolilacea TaxID=1033008 RepID=A0AAD6Z7Q7_9AGAR|nr:heterokaryon incompatibility protein-domain-containing protein [Mycena albidolilacea]
MPRHGIAGIVLALILTRPDSCLFCDPFHLFHLMNLFAYALPRGVSSSLAIANFPQSLGRPEFRYEALQNAERSIRVVSVLPPTWDLLLRCTIQEVSLDSPTPEYEALSYTWYVDRDFGEPCEGRKQTIICNEGTLLISENLHDCLLQLRDLKRPLDIWIDAISINQEDKDEKSAQVRIMGNIYERARSVFVWLGKKTPVTSIMLKRSRWILDHTNPKRQDLEAMVLSEKGLIPRNLSDYLWLAGLLVDYFALHWIIGRGYFERVWTMQEMVLAKELVAYLGNECIPLKDFTDAFRGLSTDQDDYHAKHIWGDNLMRGLPDKLRGVGFVLRTRAQHLQGTPCPLETSISEARRRHTAKPVDKVFAILSMSDKSNRMPELRADYGKEVEEVYRRVAEQIMEDRQDMRLLSLVGQLRCGAPTNALFPRASCDHLVRGIEFVEGLPSWVPDLSTEVRPTPLYKLTQTVTYDATGTMPPLFRVNNKTLSLKAAVIGTIAEVGDTNDVGHYNHHPWFFIEVVNRLGTRFPRYEPTGEPIIDALRKTLVVGEIAVAMVMRGDRTVMLSESDFTDWFCDLAAIVVIPSWWRYKPAFQFILVDTDLPLTDEERAVDVLAIALKKYASVVENSALGKCRINTMRKFVSMYDGPNYRLKEKLQERLNAYKSITSSRSYGLMKHLRPEVMDPPPYTNRFDHLYLHRRLFITDNGFMGIGPWTISGRDKVDGNKQEDVVMLVAGAPVPYIFRRKPDGCYELIGEAYCHGAMRGTNLAKEKVPGLQLDSLNFDMITVV